MISVPCGTGDIPCGYDICDADDIHFAYEGTDIISYFHEVEIYHTASAVYHIAQAIYHFSFDPDFDPYREITEKPDEQFWLSTRFYFFERKEAFLQDIRSLRNG